jgi:nitrogen-specific signal transduction histidine kinase
MHELSTVSKARREALAERLGAIARMSLGLSHELNNALGAIKSNIGIMHHHLAGDSPLHQPLNHVTHASNHAMELTQILNIYTQRKSAHLHAINLPRQLAPLLKAFAAGLPGYIRLRDESAHGNHDVLTCPAMFDQAITAILQNAADALPDKDGEISIATSDDCSPVDPEEGLFFGILPTENAVRLEICDTGEGIEPAVMEHILEPFFSCRIRGRGLGLTPAVGLVFHCNAAIQILSTPSQGTRFRLLLPTAE